MHSLPRLSLDVGDDAVRAGSRIDRESWGRPMRPLHTAGKICRRPRRGCWCTAAQLARRALVRHSAPDGASVDEHRVAADDQGLRGGRRHDAVDDDRRRPAGAPRRSQSARSISRRVMPTAMPPRRVTVDSFCSSSALSRRAAANPTCRPLAQGVYPAITLRAKMISRNVTATGHTAASLRTGCSGIGASWPDVARSDPHCSSSSSPAASDFSRVGLRNPAPASRLCSPPARGPRPSRAKESAPR